MVEYLNCGSVKRATPGFVLTFMTWLVTIRMAGVLTQRAQHGALLNTPAMGPAGTVCAPWRIWNRPGVRPR